MTRDRDARKPRIAEPQRRQGVIRFEMPEDTLPASHRARVLWDVVGTLDLATPERSRNGGANADDDPAIVAWRARMETDEAKQLYRARASLCELTNAHLRTHHGVDHFLVRGLANVTCVALLAAIASNLLQHAASLLA